MVQSIARAVTLSLCFVACAEIASAQSGAFERTGQQLEKERIDLLGRGVDLKLQQDAFNNLHQALVTKAQQINAMPAGIGRDAALVGFNREKAAWENKRADLSTRVRSFIDDFGAYTERKTQHERRLKAAAPPASTLKAGQFKPRDLVVSKTTGQLGTVLREEGGRYLVEFIKVSLRDGSTRRRELVNAGDIRRR